MQREHIFTIAIAVDDDTIREGIVKSCENQIVKQFKDEFYDKNYNGKYSPNSKLLAIVDERVSEIVKEHKDEIISLIVERASDKLVKSKALRERLESNVLSEVTADE